MAHRWRSDLKQSEVTDEQVFVNRRHLLAGLAGIGLAGGLASASSAAQRAEELVPNEWEDITNYNNYYEFGTGKSDPAKYAGALSTTPWSVEINGLVDRPAVYHLEDILKKMTIEERIYRFRCVEAWSMVVPWVGFPLAELLRRFEPKSEGKFVEFKTLYRRGEMRGTRSFTSIIDWPYSEGLRIDEAMNPLTLMTVGLYGKTLPNQSGAPLRLIVPWKYGFKNIKSIVEINVTNRQPKTSWQELAPQEYGFYANVNPEVSHPRWSQAYERRLPSSLFNPNRIKTQMFNGYGEQVASMYKGMDLARYY